MNCLNQAISEERIHQVRLLLSLDVDSEMKDRNDFDRSPLIKACLVKHDEPSLRLLKILLKFNVSINAVDLLGRSALHYACLTGKIEVVKVLANEDGIELNTQDNEGRTPLMLACVAGHLSISRMLMGKLVKFDLEIDLRDNQGYTALLLAIKNEHYDVAHDLVRYANAGITLRDNEKFLNAGDWLKFNLEERRKAIYGDTISSDRKSKHRRETQTPIEDANDDASEYPGDVPALTLTESQRRIEDIDETIGSDRFEKTDVRDSAKSVKSSAKLSGLLFEPDSFSQFGRPPSSGRGAGNYPRNISSNHEDTPRPHTGTSIASSTGRFSASSRSKQVKKMEQLREEVALSPHHITPFPNPVTTSLKRDLGTESTVSFATSRGSRKYDLESIIEDPHSGQPSRAGGRESVSRSQSRLASKTPASTSSKSIYNHDNPGRFKSAVITAQKSAEIYAIQRLKQALRDKAKRKITRASTAVFRPTSSTLTEQWMSAIIKGSKKESTNVPKTNKAPVGLQKTLELPISPQPRKLSVQSINADTVSVRSDAGSRKPSGVQLRDTNLAMKLLHASSNLSLDTLISDSDVTDSTAFYHSSPKMKKSRANQLDTIFRLYTDSCLWKPPVKKPPSLSVQINSDNSDKMTLHSEMSDDVGSIAGVEAAPVVSNPPKARPESKIGSRNKPIGSATSRVSRSSRNAGSAGGRSVASNKHAD